MTSPPLALFQKFIRFGSGILPLSSLVIFSASCLGIITMIIDIIVAIAILTLIMFGHLLRLLPGHPQRHVGLNAILSADEQERSVADNVVKCRINSLRKIQTKKMQKWQNCTPKKDNMIESKLNE